MSELYDHPEVSRRLFFPVSGDPLPETGEVLRVAIDGGSICACWCRPLAGAPTLLYLHGNGECISDQLRLWPLWARDCGCNICFVDYPGYGDSDGRPSLSGCVAATGAVASALLRHPAAELPGLILMGRSLGSVFALALAARLADEPRLRGLILESAISELRQRLEVRVPYEQLGLDRAVTEAAVARDFDARAQLARSPAPVLILHCLGDSLVPVSHSRQLAAWAGPRLHRLVLFDDGDHNSIQALNAWDYQQALKELVAAVR
jgi:pimeloyl-ACP methyl ester carboxylesterase